MTRGLDLDLTPFVPILVIFFVVVVMAIIALNNIKSANRRDAKRFHTVKAHSRTGHRYFPGQFSEQMEIDMRLPFRRFRQLYPENNWTYDEYKRMQMQTAFRRSHSSQDNKRMVR